jgi:hypothetical protein
MGLLFVQRNSTKCGVSECDCETSIIRNLCPLGAVLGGGGGGGAATNSLEKFVCGER